MTTMSELFESVVADGLLVQQAQAANLIPGGKYPFTIVKVEDRSGDQKETYDNGDPNPLYGKPVASLQVKLEGVGAKGYDDLDGRTRTHFIKVCPAVVHNAKGNLLSACKLAGQMIAVSGTAGKPFSETLAWFQHNRAQVSVGQFTMADGKVVNTTNAITALQ